jgi:hypothetical protein
MKERPILFSAPMIRALLDGRKTQTRRIVKPQHASCDRIADQDEDQVLFMSSQGTHCQARNPYGVPGDLLWVRENYRLDVAYDNLKPSEVTGRAAVWYEAGGAVGFGVSGRMHPSIHMPRWASRITLAITEVRVERLQEITEADARAEGIVGDSVIINCHAAGGRHQEVTAYRYWPSMQVSEHHEGHDNAIDAYQELWEMINGAGSWDANPWVWAVTFERII